MLNQIFPLNICFISQHCYCYQHNGMAISVIITITVVSLLLTTNTMTSHIFGLDDYCAICGNGHRTNDMEKFWEQFDYVQAPWAFQPPIWLDYLFFSLAQYFCEVLWRYECSTETPKLGISLHIQFLSQVTRVYIYFFTLANHQLHTSVCFGQHLPDR